MINLKSLFVAFFIVQLTYVYGVEKPGMSQPLYLKADSISYNQDKDTTQARGNVEIYHTDGYVLLADEADYIPGTNQLEARGNVKIYNDKKDIIFAEKFLGAPTFKEGSIINPSALTEDNRRLIARSGYKDGAVTRLEKGIYTPCNLCKDKKKAPLWQIKAREIIHDEEDQDIIYKDAWLEIWGTPIFYLPYLSQPDPSVKRRSGLIGIKVGNTKREGATIIPAYYYTFSPSNDFTFDPIIFSKNNPILRGTYRHRFSRAQMILSGSITRSDLTTGSTASPVKKGIKTRWHTKSTAKIDINDTWRLNMQYHRASDETYIQKFKIEDNQAFLPDNLESSIMAEGFYDRDYALIRGLAFQTTKESISQKTMPYVLPQAQYFFETTPTDNGSYFYGDVGALGITRSSGADVHRINMRSGWFMPFSSSYGDIITTKLQARLDGYHSSHFIPSGSAKARENYIGRFFPQLMVEWRHPLVTEELFFPAIISPVVNFVGGPVKGVKEKIPNEDSQAGIELTEASLFSLNRFTGLDRVDSGSRLNYGLIFELYPKVWRAVKLFIGQSYGLNKNKSIPQGTGVNKGFSDIVGGLYIVPGSYFDIRYIYLFNYKSMRARRSQVTFSAGVPIFRLTGNYTYFDKNATNTVFNGREQIMGTLSSQFMKFWTAEFTLTRNLGKKGKNLARGVGVTYEDECFKANLAFAQTYFQNRDIKPDTGILLTLTFKTLGEVNTGSTLNRVAGNPSNKKKK